MENELQLLLMGLLGVIVYSLKDIITNLSNKLITKINKKDIDITKHNIYLRINTLEFENKVKDYSNNVYKNEIIKLRQSIFLSILNTFFEDIKTKDLNKLNTDEFNDLIDSFLTNVKDIDTQMLKSGVSQKTVNVLEQSIYVLNSFFISTIKCIPNEPFYDNNLERMWSIMSFCVIYLDNTNKLVIEMLEKANGSLYGEVYNGIKNEEK